jgi:hypothetical protein
MSTRTLTMNLVAARPAASLLCGHCVAPAEWLKSANTCQSRAAASERFELAEQIQLRIGG